MGWVATVAGTLIAVMFVYNWFNKGEPTHSSETQEQVKKPTVLTEQNTNRKSKPDKSKISVPQDAAPTVTSNNVPEQIKIDVQEPRDTRPQTFSNPPKTTAMLPPAPPTITPAPAGTMAPPRSKSPPRLKPPTFGQSPAASPRLGGSTLRPPPSAASSLRIPATKVLSNASMAPSSSLMPPPKKASKQVTLEPGRSPLDWAALTSNPNNKLRGKDAPDGLVRVTPSQLKAQNGRKGRDVWTVFQGKVYNISPYVPFHPGGKGEILRGAGKDSAKLFMEVHPWVNWDGMLGECCVGILVGEDEDGKNMVNRLDEMD